MKKRNRVLAVITAMTVAAGMSVAAANAHRARQGEGNAAEATSFTADKGTFRILLNGRMVGSEQFEIGPAAGGLSARGSTTLSIPGGGDQKTASQYRLAADCTPIHYEWSSETQKKASGVVDFADGTAKTRIDMGGKSPYQQNFTFPSPRVAILDNNLYHQYGVLALLYDWKTGGKQTFPVLIPQDSTPGSISVESMGEQDVDGAKYDELRVDSKDLEIMLYVDGAHRLMRLEVPSAKVVVARE